MSQDQNQAGRSRQPGLRRLARARAALEAGYQRPRSGQRRLRRLALLLLLLGLPVGPLGPPSVGWAGAGPGGSTANTSSPIAAAPDPLFDDEPGAEAPARLGDYADPLEAVNRRTHAFNSTVEEWLLDPVSEAYSKSVPASARHGVRGVLRNLDEPTNAINGLLQLQWSHAATAAGRFIINTTIGLAGVLDPATGMGLDSRSSNFGETLADAGVQSGPYLVLPLIGPTNARDGTGIVVDFFFRPTTWILGPIDLLTWTAIHGGTAGVAIKEENLEAIDALKQSSLDYYAALRSAHHQMREAELRQNQATRLSD